MHCYSKMINYYKMRQFLTAILLFFSLTISSQTKNDFTKITSDDRHIGDCFGWATAIYNNFCLIGSPLIGVNNMNHRILDEAGTAFLYKKQKNGEWLLTQKFLPFKPKANDEFGGSVALNDSIVVIGSTGYDSDTVTYPDFMIRHGAVFSYKINKEGQKTKTQKIILEKSGQHDSFGDVLKLSKNTLAVSAPYGEKVKGSTVKGAVYIYTLSIKSEWVLSETVYPPTKDDDRFGKEIAISPDYLLIQSDGNQKVHVYQKQSSGKFKFIKTIISPSKTDIDNQGKSAFGSSLGILNNQLFIAAYGSFNNNFKGDSATLSFRNKHLLGCGIVYNYQINDVEVVLKQSISPADKKGEMHFGNDLSVNDSALVIAAFGDQLEGNNDEDNTYAGAAYVYKYKSNEWVQQQKIVSNIRSKWDKFAFSIFLHNKQLIVGSRFEKENSKEKLPLDRAGAAYIYELK